MNNDPNQMKQDKKDAKKEKWKEPKIKWEFSGAKKLLYADIMAGRVPLKATDANNKSTMQLKDIYKMHPEFSEYHYSKFSSRVSSIRFTIRARNKRADEDQQHFAECIKNHPASSFSHKGFIQWQGSEAQEQAQKDIEANLHENMKKQDLWELRPEYYENFPLKDFRDKIRQEVRTAKYLHDIKVNGKRHKAS